MPGTRPRARLPHKEPEHMHVDHLLKDESLGLRLLWAEEHS
ncbi:hypothetical protein [Streptomyces sp. GbtcB7]|nr:hypothetical protein [Streptomyces sp. GbtcB7]